MSEESPILAAHGADHTTGAARYESALSRWDNEGGAMAEPAISLPADLPELTRELTPKLTNAELVHLRIRVIALENLLIAMLARVPEEQTAMGDAMAAHIAPRLGSTPHPLTEHAGQRMKDLLARALHYRNTDIS